MDGRAAGFVSQSAMVGKASADGMSRAYADPLTQLISGGGECGGDGRSSSSGGFPGLEKSWILYPFWLLFQVLVILFIIAVLVFWAILVML